MMKNLLKKLTASTEDPERMRLKQYTLMGGVIGMGLMLLYFVTQSPTEKSQEKRPEAKKEQIKLETPFEAINPQDVWVNRVQKEAEEAKSEAKAVREENQLLAKKMDVMEKLLQGSALFQPPQNPPDAPPSIDSNASDLNPIGPRSAPQTLRPPVIPAENTSRRGEERLGLEDDKLFGVASSKFLQISLPEGTLPLMKNVDNYVPAGSYARAVLTSGVVASTAIQASSQPQPIMMRLVDEGRLPRGFRGTLKENVLIGACYGDLSSERVMCRLETMAWIEENGVTVEKKVEGWVIGEDGRPGLRGEVVDRSGDAVRDTMIAGVLSGFAQFLKTESTSSVYPISPFGQTNALTGQRALAGAASSGTSNALDKLAEFSIKRAEQMQPVILIASGRVVDVVFKTGIDTRAEVATPSLTLINQKQTSPKEQTHEAY